MAKKPTLWGSAEVVAAFDVSRETLRKWRGQADFPEPLAELSAGPVWDAADVKAWHRQRDSKRTLRTTGRGGAK